MKVLIVGGVAGGASAAVRLRRLDEEAQIIIFERGGHISYANCGFPYYIGNVIKNKEDLILVTPERMKTRFNIEVRVLSEVIKIVPEMRHIEVINGRTGEKYIETYDKLILSPGSMPIMPTLPGVDSERIFKLRSLGDTFKIKEFIDKNNPKKVIVVGSGFVGLEVAENFANLGIETTVVELSNHVIGPLDFDMASFVHNHLARQKNFKLFLNTAVKAFQTTESRILAKLSTGEELYADMVMMSVGVKPDNALAVEAGLKIGTTGGILVNQHMQTSNPDIYAVGDAVEVFNYTSGNKALMQLAGPANKQGRVAADNICDGNEIYRGTQGTSILKVFDMTVAVTGNNEEMLKKLGHEYEKSFTHSASHAGYYPGAAPMTIKLLFVKSSGKILGAQIVGFDGVDKRMDVISTAIRAGLTVFDLEKLELSYAPMFSSAKDPVNIAGYVAANIIKSQCQVIHWHDIDDVDAENSIIIDVRTEEEYSQGTIKNAINIPIDDLRQRLSEIPKDKDIYVFCQVAYRGYLAYRILKHHGYNVKNLSGGYRLYREIISQYTLKNV